MPVISLTQWLSIKETNDHWKSWLPQIARQWLFLVAIAVLVETYAPETMPLFIASCLGVISRDFMYMKSSQKIWPVLTTLIKWDQVNELLAGADEPTQR
jgi:hypothetical protein